jgi:hypothetical protein
MLIHALYYLGQVSEENRTMTYYLRRATSRALDHIALVVIAALVVGGVAGWVVFA